MANDDISLFRSLLQIRRFDCKTLAVLESILSARDVQALLRLRSALRDLLRSVAAAAIPEISGKSATDKLFFADFFVKAFALVGDAEGCLALKYEAFVLRETNCFANQALQVSRQEWLTFAEDSFHNGFYANAVKGSESALQCFFSDHTEEETDECAVQNILKLKDSATALIASDTVRTEAVQYMKRKHVLLDEKSSTCSARTHVSVSASSMFRSGIKRRNMQILRSRQSLHMKPFT